MKKVLLAGTALVGLALIASPAAAELKLDLGGYFRGYAVYTDQDNDDDKHSFEFRRNTEIHFTGETTLDNGLTVGVHVEQVIDGPSAGTETITVSGVQDDNGDTVDDFDITVPAAGGNNLNNESYAYFSGSWGRVNFGNEDGAAYLLQVAAPSADSNIDGLRTYIQAFESQLVLEYAHADFGNGVGASGIASVNGSVDRLTYLTPKFNGFQAGVSYAPTSTLATSVIDMSADDGSDDATFEDLWEVAVRWDGEFQGFGISAGAGYSDADAEAAGADDLTTWNLGLGFAWNQFSFGGAYKDSSAGLGGTDEDSTTWVVGAGWDNGPYHLGVSYLDRKDDDAAGDLDSEKLALGGAYTFGPGMTFRGAVAFGEAIDAAGDSNDFTQVTFGTDIQF